MAPIAVKPWRWSAWALVCESSVPPEATVSDCPIQSDEPSGVPVRSYVDDLGTAPVAPSVELAKLISMGRLPRLVRRSRVAHLRE